MPYIEVSVEFEVFCGTCGAGICNTANVATKHSWQHGDTHSVTVDACKKCLEAARDEGESDGHLSRDAEVDALKSRIEELEAAIAEATEAP